MDWDDLHTFLAIARHGSLSAAARVLGVRQSTISRRLEAMQARTGARLLDRTPAGYVLTAAGTAILGNVERIEGEALAVERVITGRDIRLEGQVRITAVESVATAILVPILADVALRHPGIEVELIADFRTLSLARREADVAVRLARPTPQDLAVRKIGEMGFGLYASAGYLDRHGMPDFAAGAPGHRLILNPGEPTDRPELRWMLGLAARAGPALRSLSRAAHAAAAVAGMGIACLPRFSGDATGLVRLAPPTPPPLREIWLAVHDDIRHTPRIRALTDALAAGVRARAAELAPAD